MLLTGSLIGLGVPLAKLAQAAGIPALLWSLVMSGGAALVLFVGMRFRRERLPVDTRCLRYYLIAGVISYLLPNLLVFVMVPHLGVGVTSILFTFSPIFTLLLSLVFKISKPAGLGVAGIALGFVGALMIVLSKGRIEAPVEVRWLLLGFLIPLSLAGGNLYRTVAWPPGSSSQSLAVGTNSAAGVVALALIGVSHANGSPAGLAAAAAAPLLVLAQITLSALMFSVFFRLQKVGGPVYLSQVGYVVAATGLAVGSLVMGERYGMFTWLGAAIVAVAVVLTTVSQARNSA